MATSAYRVAAGATSPDDVLIEAAVVTHPDVAEPLRFIAADEPMTVEGNDYLSMPFRVLWPDESEDRLPRASIGIDNVGRPLTRWIEATGGITDARITLMHIRQPRSGAAVVEESVTLDVAGAQIEATMVRIELGFGLDLQGPAVALRYTPETAPALFRGDEP